MEVEILIIGQGLCGTFLSWYLQKAGISFVIIDESKPDTASKAASGIINPVTGRRIVKTWMIDELMPFAWGAYKQLGDELKIECIFQKRIIDFFPNPQMRLAFEQRFEEDPQFLYKPLEEKKWAPQFHYAFGYGEIAPCFLVLIAELLTAYRVHTINQHQLVEEHFEIKELELKANKVHYRGIQASKIIFCDGVMGESNPYFKKLPFASNKGEALVIETENIPRDHIFKKGLSLVPLASNHWWVGSSYEWDYTDPGPTELFKKRTTDNLRSWLKSSFRIREHFASIRPATLERRPFVGFHPHLENVGILNGMGSKGCSLAPYFASQLVNQITQQASLIQEASILRFKKILGS